MLIPSINLYCIYSCLDLLYLVDLCSVVTIQFLIVKYVKKHSLMVIQYILRKALFTNTVCGNEAVNR